MVGRTGTTRIATIAALLVLLLTGVAAAAAGGGGPLDPTFGEGGRVLASLPDASAPSRFVKIAPASDGRFLVAQVTEAYGSAWSFEIERREPDGALDPAFGEGGSVRVGSVEALVEDPAGGVVYDDYSLKRLEPDGAPDTAFDARANLGEGESPSIAIDPQGRIVVVQRNPLGPRYHAHAGEAEVRRFEPDGEPDRSFGSNGVLYLGQAGEVPQIGSLPDGSMLVDSASLDHVSADGAVLSESKLAGSRSSLAVFPDGSFAVSGTASEATDCTITRYAPGGSRDEGFAQGGVFDTSGLRNCSLTAAPGGGLLVSGTTEGGAPGLLLLTAAGAPAAGFGNGGSVAVPSPAAGPGAAPLTIEGLVVWPEGRIVVAGGRESAVLVGLGSNGALDPSFGAYGTIVGDTSIGSLTRPRSIVSEPDGELIVTGVTTADSNEPHPFWMRFDADGNVIPTVSGEPFASVPVVAVRPVPAGPDYLYALVQKGKAGSFLAKFERDGDLVGSFGEGGFAPLPHGLESSSFVVDADGGVTAVGHIGAGRMAAYRLTSTGQPEGGFGHRGLATVGLPGKAEVEADSGALLPGGDLILGGLVEDRLAFAKLGPDGRLRRDFGRDGFLTCRCGGARPDQVDVVAHRGHIYALDHWAAGAAGEGDSLVRVSAGGRLDRTFAGRGYRPVGIGAPITLFARGGRLIVVGQKAAARGPAQVREFRLDGVVARSIDAGRTLVPGSNSVSFNHRLGVALQPDGRIVLAGEMPAKAALEGSALELLGLR